MYRRLIVAILLMATLGFNTHAITLDRPSPPDGSYQGQYPAVDIPREFRQRNWGSGSCVHASFIMLLRAQRKFELAEWWRQNNEGGEWPEDMAAKLDAKGVRYAYTAGKGDVKFLDWAVKTHRGCGVTVRAGSHMIILIHFDKKWAGLIDNNSPEEIIWVPRKAFIAEWLNSNSWAITPIYRPGPPMPVKIQ